MSAAGWLLDTSILIHLRDGDSVYDDMVLALGALPVLSVVSHVELEGGVYRDARLAPKRRQALDALLGLFPVIDFDAACAQAYGNIVADTGYSRRKIVDRMIAATALVHEFTLVTINDSDFRDIRGLKLEAWPSQD